MLIYNFAVQQQLFTIIYFISSRQLIENQISSFSWMDYNKDDESNDDNKVQFLTSNSIPFDGDAKHCTEKSFWINRIDQGTVMASLSRSHEEDVYEDLCYVTLRYYF